MAIPALKTDREKPLEESVARLENNVEHIQRDVSDMQVGIRRLGDKIEAVDQKLIAKIDGVDQRLTGKVDSLKDVVTALAINMEKQFGALRTARALDRVGWLIMSGGIFGIMARAFKWI